MSICQSSKLNFNEIRCLGMTIDVAVAVVDGAEAEVAAGGAGVAVARAADAPATGPKNAAVAGSVAEAAGAGTAAAGAEAGASAAAGEVGTISAPTSRTINPAETSAKYAGTTINSLHSKRTFMFLTPMFKCVALLKSRPTAVKTRSQ